ncbi:MAG: putative ATPase [Colwellia sp.]|jgi:predicted ATPase
MGNMEDTSKLISDINNKSASYKKLINNNPLFISKIRFPVFKNLEPNAEIIFEYPLTVFVGQNGCGKSSVLHALQGAPKGYSVGNYWFSTSLDPIVEGKGKPSCFIFEYYNADAKKKVEIIKQRVQFKKQIKGVLRKDPDYWEPSRASIEYQMVPPKVIKNQPEPGANLTRWTVPKINVEYIDFRSELSAFDQYFYFGEKPQKLTRYKSKQDRIRSWVKNKLSPILSGKKQYAFDRSKNKLNKNPVVLLSDDALTIISVILSKKYTECRMIEHKCFGMLGYSIQFKSGVTSYTEAFAGSGEMAVVRVVHTVLNAEPNSLIILDEPEVSLHPGAQKKLRNFLLEQIIDKNHQIIISSHSPTFIEGLPKSALKVFTPNNNGKFRIAPNMNINDAFIQIGQTIVNKNIIIVEDGAAKSLIEKCLKELGQKYLELFCVQYYPGGETTIFKDLVVHSRKEDTNIFVIFDGDIKKGDWPTTASITSDDLDAKIKEFCGQEVKTLGFGFDGGQDAKTKEKAEAIKRQFLDYIFDRCFFLPTQIPEELIWNASTIDNKEQFEKGIDNNKDRFKGYIGNYVHDQIGDDLSMERAVFIRQILKKHFDEKNDDYVKLLGTIKKIKEKLT